MNTKERERADEQSGHSQEGIIEIRIFAFLVIIGMGEVFGKPRIGLGMTFRTGLDQIGLIDGGIR